MNETRCSGASRSPSSESAFPKCWLSPFLVYNGDRASCVKLLCVGNHYEMPGSCLDDIRIVSPSAIWSYQTGLAGSLSQDLEALEPAGRLGPEGPLSWQPHLGLLSPSKRVVFQWKAPGVASQLSLP